MTPALATLLAALALCTTDTECESIALALCAEGEIQYCQTPEETTR